MTTDKLPPHDIAAEEAVNGSLLIGGTESFIEILSQVNVDDFYNEANRWLFLAASNLYDRTEAIDQITLAQELDRQGRLEACGGAAYMSHLISIVPTSIDILHYAKIVQRLSINRQIILSATEMIALGYQADPDPAKTLGACDEMLMDIRKRTVGSPIVGPGLRRKLLLERYEALWKLEKGVAVASGFKDLDWCLGGGFFAGDFILLGARPSMGKTSLLQSIANNVGDRGDNVLFCAVEMPWESMSDRDMAGRLRRPITDIRRGGYDDKTYTDLLVAVDELSGRQVWYMDDVPMTVEKIMRAGLELQLRKGLALIIVDYLGILSGEDKWNNYERVGYISRKMKEIARVLRVPVLAAHQLNRDLEKEKDARGRPGDKRPQLWHLRDSGNLEEDADVVMFLYRDNYYDWDLTDTNAEILLAKVRQGEAGKGIQVAFDKKGQRYLDIERHR